MPALNYILHLLETYKYLIILPIAIIEGPILSILTGFLVSLGKLNIFLSFVILIGGDIIGDSLAYFFGRLGEGIVRRYGHYVGVTENKINQTKIFFEQNHRRAVIVSKLTHGIGITGLIMAGVLYVPYGRYIKSCLIVTLFQTLILFAIGILFGHAYTQIQKYLNYFAATASISILIVIVIFIFYRFKARK